MAALGVVRASSPRQVPRVRLGRRSAGSPAGAAGMAVGWIAGRRCGGDSAAAAAVGPGGAPRPAAAGAPVPAPGRRIVGGARRGPAAAVGARWIPAAGGRRRVDRPLRGAVGRAAPAPAVAARPGAPARRSCSWPGPVRSWATSSCRRRRSPFTWWASRSGRSPSPGPRIPTPSPWTPRRRRFPPPGSRFPLAASGTFPATGTRVEEAAATGAVQWQNCDPSRSYTIPARTIVRTSSGVGFATTDGILVPVAILSGTPPNLRVKCQVRSVDVVAVRPGPSGNVDAGTIRARPRHLRPGAGPGDEPGRDERGHPRGVPEGRVRRT